MKVQLLFLRCCFYTLVIEEKRQTVFWGDARFTFERVARLNTIVFKYAYWLNKQNKMRSTLDVECGIFHRYGTN